MKLVIPPKCQMGVHPIRIRQSEKLLAKLDYRGSGNMKEGIIRLSFKERQLEDIFATLIHEGLHQAGILSGLELKEEEIIPLAEFMTQFLLSLGIEPDFSQIPEEE